MSERQEAERITCITCKVEKDRSEFGQLSRWVYRCKPCVSAYNRPYAKRWHEEHKVYARKWHKKNNQTAERKKYMREYMREYYKRQKYK